MMALVGLLMCLALALTFTNVLSQGFDTKDFDPFPQGTEPPTDHTLVPNLDGVKDPFSNPRGVRPGTDCGNRDISQCTELLEVLTRKEIGFAATERELNDMCPVLLSGLQCIDNYTLRCLNPQHRSYFNELYAGTIRVIKDLCNTRGQYQQEYIQHAPCMRQVHPKYNRCSETYHEKTARLNKVNSAVVQFSESERRRNVITLCCSFQEYLQCSERIVYETCGNSTATFTKQFLNRMAGPIVQENCPNFDKIVTLCPDHLTKVSMGMAREHLLNDAPKSSLSDVFENGNLMSEKKDERRKAIRLYITKYYLSKFKRNFTAGEIIDEKNTTVLNEYPLETVPSSSVKNYSNDDFIANETLRSEMFDSLGERINSSVEHLHLVDDLTPSPPHSIKTIVEPVRISSESQTYQSTSSNLADILPAITDKSDAKRKEIIQSVPRLLRIRRFRKRTRGRAHSFSSRSHPPKRRRKKVLKHEKVILTKKTMRQNPSRPNTDIVKHESHSTLGAKWRHRLRHRRRKKMGINQSPKGNRNRFYGRRRKIHPISKKSRQQLPSHKTPNTSKHRTLRRKKKVRKYARFPLSGVRKPASKRRKLKGIYRTNLKMGKKSESKKSKKNDPKLQTKEPQEELNSFSDIDGTNVKISKETVPKKDADRKFTNETLEERTVVIPSLSTDNLTPKNASSTNNQTSHPIIIPHPISSTTEIPSVTTMLTEAPKESLSAGKGFAASIAVTTNNEPNVETMTEESLISRVPDGTEIKIPKRSDVRDDEREVSVNTNETMEEVELMKPSVFTDNPIPEDLGMDRNNKISFKKIVPRLTPLTTETPFVPPVLTESPKQIEPASNVFASTIGILTNEESSTENEIEEKMNFKFSGVTNFIDTAVRNTSFKIPLNSERIHAANITQDVIRETSTINRSIGVPQGMGNEIIDTDIEHITAMDGTVEYYDLNNGSTELNRSSDISSSDDLGNVSTGIEDEFYLDEIISNDLDNKNDRLEGSLDLTSGLDFKETHSDLDDINDRLEGSLGLISEHDFKETHSELDNKNDRLEGSLQDLTSGLDVNETHSDLDNKNDRLEGSLDLTTGLDVNETHSDLGNLSRMNQSIKSNDFINESVNFDSASLTTTIDFIPLKEMLINQTMNNQIGGPSKDKFLTTKAGNVDQSSSLKIVTSADVVEDIGENSSDIGSYLQINKTNENGHLDISDSETYNKTFGENFTDSYEIGFSENYDFRTVTDYIYPEESSTESYFRTHVGNDSVYIDTMMNESLNFDAIIKNVYDPQMIINITLYPDSISDTTLTPITNVNDTLHPDTDDNMAGSPADMNYNFYPDNINDTWYSDMNIVNTTSYWDQDVNSDSFHDTDVISTSYTNLDRNVTKINQGINTNTTHMQDLFANATLNRGTVDNDSFNPGTVVNDTIYPNKIPNVSHFANYFPTQVGIGNLDNPDGLHTNVKDINTTSVEQETTDKFSESGLETVLELPYKVSDIDDPFEDSDNVIESKTSYDSEIKLSSMPQTTLSPPSTLETKLIPNKTNAERPKTSNSALSGSFIIWEFTRPNHTKVYDSNEPKSLNKWPSRNETKGNSLEVPQTTEKTEEDMTLKTRTDLESKSTFVKFSENNSEINMKKLQALLQSQIESIVFPVPEPKPMAVIALEKRTYKNHKELKDFMPKVINVPEADFVKLEHPLPNDIRFYVTAERKHSGVKIISTTKSPPLVPTPAVVTDEEPMALRSAPVVLVKPDKKGRIYLSESGVVYRNDTSLHEVGRNLKIEKNPDSTVNKLIEETKEPEIDHGDYSSSASKGCLLYILVILLHPIIF